MNYRNKLEEMSYVEPFNFVSKYIKNGDRILEIGAKWGNHAKMITDNFDVDYNIYDLNDDRDCCFDLKFNKVNAAFDKFPDNDESFDLIFSCHVLEHIPNFQHFFQENHRVLKKNGIMIVVMPNFSSIFQRILFLKNGVASRLGGKINDGGHLNFITYQFLKGYLEDDFKTEEVKAHSFVDIIFYRKLTQLFGKRLKEQLKTSSPFFGYNIMLCFSKI